MNRIIFALLVLSSSLVPAQKKVCISVDDLPEVHYGVQAHKYVITEKLISTFLEYNIPAIGYVNEVKLYKSGKLDSSIVVLLDQWLQNGMDLGNHTYSHKNYHQVTWEVFKEDILKGEKVIKSLAKKYNKEVKYFRHPYLRSGADKEQTDQLKAYLSEIGYKEAPVTIDNNDYLYASAYAKAYKNKDTDLMEKIGTHYVAYMERKLLFFENQSQALYARNIAHILLIHASMLNADYLDDLMSVYQKHGYEFISQEEALKDPVYQENVTRFGDWGISWLDRWALSKGKRGEFFKGDPQVDEFIRD